MWQGFQRISNIEGTWKNPYWWETILLLKVRTLFQKYLGAGAYFIVKTLKIGKILVNFKLMRLGDGSIVHLKAILDCDFAFAAAIFHFR